MTPVFKGFKRLLLALSLAAGVVVIPASASASFAPATNFATALQPSSVAAGDFNGDGNQDLVVANSLSNSVSILRGNGVGSLGAPSNFPIAAGTGPNAVATGDFNRDGFLDLAVMNFGTNNVSRLFGNGLGSFSAATNFAVGTGPVAVAVADLNGDGVADIAVGNQTSNNISRLLNNGTGGFGAAANTTVGTTPRSLDLADVDNDGDRDLVTANQGSANVSRLLGNGAGAFGASSNFSTGIGSVPRGVAVADLNNDGNRDLAVAALARLFRMLAAGRTSGTVAAGVTVESSNQTRVAARIRTGLLR